MGQLNTRFLLTLYGITLRYSSDERDAKWSSRCDHWFTGGPASGSGKSTLAHAVEESLHQRGCRTFVLDGDNVRHGLCGDLGFSSKDRQENIRRIGEIAKLFMESGVIVLTAFISPYRADRERIRDMNSSNKT